MVDWFLLFNKDNLLDEGHVTFTYLKLIHILWLKSSNYFFKIFFFNVFCNSAVWLLDPTELGLSYEFYNNNNAL